MKLTYDEKSFILDNKRIWLVDAEIHYFRHPRKSWRKALLRAKRAGINCISTYIAWNYHEPEKGKYDFSGDKDVAHFIDLIGELGMYAMIRPGPYICSEWDCGGIPAWVCNKHGIRTRESDPLYMEEFELWFDKLLPILSVRQITKGGPVITIQNENEYCGGWDESTRSYIRTINAIFKKHGFDIPILGCNVHAASSEEVVINGKKNREDQIIDRDMILTYNCGTDVAPVYDLRKKQPYAPVIVTELWSGAQSFWGQVVSDWPEKTLQTRIVYDFTSSGAQVCYYMFEGGTNFGFWAGEYIATSYQSAYPVGDGGRLREKYYMLKQVNHFITGFGEFLAESEEIQGMQGITAPEGVRLVLRKNEKGAVLFVSLADERRSIHLNLADGSVLPVNFGDVAAAALPVDFEALPGIILDYCNLSLFTCCQKKRLIIFYGAAGTEGIISINGNEYVLTVKRNDVCLLKLNGATILVADENMAQRYWDVDGHIFFGPDFAGEVGADGSVPLRVSAATNRVIYLNEQGDIQPIEFAAPSVSFVPPVLDSWKSMPCNELSLNETGWKVIDHPTSHEDLEAYYGYVWYSAELESDHDEVRQLYFSNTPNRVSIYVNGVYCGTYGEKRTKPQRLGYDCPADFLLENITVPLKKGNNHFVFLSDNQGHDYGMYIPKGITGDVYAGVRTIQTANIVVKDPAPVSATAFKWLYCSEYKHNEPLPSIEFDIELKPGETGYITLYDIPSWVTVNGIDLPSMSYPLNLWNMWPSAKAWHNFEIPGSEAGGKFKINVSYRLKSLQNVLDNMQVFAAEQSGQLTNWAWKPFNEKIDFTGCTEKFQNSGQKNEDIVLLLPSVDSTAQSGCSFIPASFECWFPMPEGEQSVFLNLGDMKKGQIYLNGLNVGRFWNCGGMAARYLLPREWMKEKNQLILFEELGIRPHGTCLEYDNEQPLYDNILFQS